ncbi:hypothetical protein MRX96_039006, partial [Rhipicephalus microplus]
ASGRCSLTPHQYSCWRAPANGPKKSFQRLVESLDKSFWLHPWTLPSARKGAFWSSSIPAASGHEKPRQGRLHYCNVCNYKTDQSSNLKVHLRVHTGKRPFKCHLCAKSFSVNSSLKKHLSTHTGERPYQCYYCPRSFSIRDTLTNHLRIHTGDRPYKCHICPDSFSQKSSLQYHLLTHSNEQSYKCPSCPQTFQLKDSLRKHVYRDHRK